MADTHHEAPLRGLRALLHWLASPGGMTRLVGLGLLLATGLAYAQAVAADFVGFDDMVYVFRNPNVLRGLNLSDMAWAFTSLREANWHPLVWLSLQLDAQFFGLFAPGYHLTNVILHAGSTLLFFLVLREGTGRFWASALAAALWGLHPLPVESVAWVSERKDVLSTVFWLLTMIAYGWYARCPGWRRYLAVLAMFILGNMAKQMLVTLPFVLLLWDIWPLGRFGRDPEQGRWMLRRIVPIPSWPLVREKLPLFALSGVMCWVTILAQDKAMAPLSALPLWQRLNNALVSYVKYLEKTFWPVNLAPFYPHPTYTTPWWEVALCGLGLLAITVLAVRLLRTRPWLAVGWFWFLGTLVPVIGLVQVGSQGMADRYAYVPHLGLFICLAWGAADLAGWFGVGKRAAWVLSCALVGVLWVLTFRQGALWKDTKTLFTHAAEVTERNFLAEHALAGEAAAVKDWAAYQRHYQNALEYNPYYVCGMHNAHGFLLARLGAPRGAKIEFVQAEEVCPDNPQVMTNFGGLLAYLGRYSDAISKLESTLAQFPHYKPAEENLAVVRRQFDEYRDLNAQLAANATLAAAAALAANASLANNCTVDVNATLPDVIAHHANATHTGE